MSKLILLLAFAAAPLAAQNPIGAIDFFGYKGIDLENLRAALPVHVGDEMTAGTRDAVRAGVMKAIGKEPTDVESVCCNAQGKTLLYIGVPGESSRPFEYNANPGGSEKLPQEIVALNDRLDHAIMLAARKGGDAAQEDDSRGYSLTNDPDARAIQLSIRSWAVGHEKELLSAMDSASVQDRRVASETIGYADQSKEQIIALVRASRDPDDVVRNNSTRALGVMLRSGIRLAAEIPAEGFVAMMNSGRWTDRNKASFVLWSMTAARDPALLAKLRTDALDSLIEMESWSSPGHAFAARFILGRMAGLRDDQIAPLVMAERTPTELIEAARKK